FVILTHAHIDHSGLLPRLAALGWRGRIYATPATADLCGAMLPDAAHIQEKEAEWARERAHERRRDADAPLYTMDDAEQVLRQFEEVPYATAFSPAPGIVACFRDAGHILGSAIAEIQVDDAGRRFKLVCSGDLGQPGRPVLPDPTPIAEADALLVESTYGNRLHKTLAQTYDELAAVLSATLPRGNVIVPAFAVGRTQEVLHVLADLVRAGRLPALNVFVDSPLATKATAITARYAHILDRETRDLAAWQAKHPERMRVSFTESVADSMAINAIRAGAVIVAASGMCDAGRVRHHLRHNLSRESSAVVFTGFQAAGTLGRALVDGARTVRLFREDVPVRASIHTIGGLSAHGDQAALLAWLGAFHRPPARTFVVHGELAVAEGFAALVGERLRFPEVSVPVLGSTHRLA
ncbi:MAG TPA: MBL fold metallo-hydrolase, partial [Casimicrobiaceae bacterium]|nr:MBL fold metallo-hydrolase [Casimicrobiaceae bacterium]